MHVGNVRLILQASSSPLSPATAHRGPALAIDRLAWWLFLVWTTIGFIVMPLGIGERTVERWLTPGPARHALFSLLHVSDAIWIYLAAVVVYLHTAAAEGLATARCWAVILLTGSGLSEWIGAQTGYPFGPYRYTDSFGWRIGGVLPVAIPLAWMIVLLCARTLVLKLRPASTRTELALGVAAIATLTDINLEAVAWKVRGYWIWYPDAIVPPSSWPPLQNYLSWFALSFALTCALPRNDALRMHRATLYRPIVVLCLMNALFIAVYAARWASLKR